MNTYRVTAPVARFDTEPGGTVELDLSQEAEADELAAGFLQIVPREYRVIGSQEVHGAKPGAKFKAALTVPIEAALAGAGHIERVTPKEAPANQPAKPAGK